MRDEHFPNGVNGRLRMGLALRGPCLLASRERLRARAPAVETPVRRS
jgi:hypothetical protein